MCGPSTRQNVRRKVVGGGEKVHPMSRKMKTGIAVAGLLVIAVIGSAHWFIGMYNRRQVKWWVEHYYPVFFSLAPNEQLYFDSYAEWSRAGQAIPDIDRILIEMYSETESPDEKGKLLYAMGAVPGARTIEFLSEVLRSSANEPLRMAALNSGLLYNLEMEMVQPVLCDFVRDPQQPVGYRCQVLADLIKIGNKDAIDYADRYGLQLLWEAQSAGVHRRVRENLVRMLSSTAPTSQPLPR